jgi:hypothetical protein
MRQYPAEHTEDSRILSAAVKDVFPDSSIKMNNFLDENEDNGVLIVTGIDEKSSRKLTSTIGLHEAPNLVDGRSIRVELMFDGHDDGSEIQE